jgi:UrcA family protein
MHPSIKALVASIAIVASIPVVLAGTNSTDDVIRAQAVIHYSDLNLSKEGDAKAMLRRIDRAAVDVCGGQHPFGLYDGLAQQDFAKCRANAVATAVAHLGEPMVSRVYADAAASNRGS